MELKTCIECPSCGHALDEPNYAPAAAFVDCTGCGKPFKYARRHVYECEAVTPFPVVQGKAASKETAFMLFAGRYSALLTGLDGRLQEFIITPEEFAALKAHPRAALMAKNNAGESWYFI